MIKHNAALRGECRLNQVSADYFHHQNSPHTKNATRHESLLNALLYFSCPSSYWLDFQYRQSDLNQMKRPVAATLNQLYTLVVQSEVADDRNQPSRLNERNVHLLFFLTINS